MFYLVLKVLLATNSVFIGNEASENNSTCWLLVTCAGSKIAYGQILNLLNTVPCPTRYGFQPAGQKANAKLVEHYARKPAHHPLAFGVRLLLFWRKQVRKQCREAIFRLKGWPPDDSLGCPCHCRFHEQRQSAIWGLRGFEDDPANIRFGRLVGICASNIIDYGCVNIAILMGI
jgi:hypothetical protein